MDCSCGKFGDWFYHADRIIDAAKRITPAAVIGTSNELLLLLILLLMTLVEHKFRK